MPKISKLISTFSSKEAEQLFKKTKRIKIHPGLDILYTFSDDKPFGRILVVTPKRIGKAHKRNLIRRRLKAIFYEQELYKHRIDLMIIVKKEGIELQFDQLKQILEKIISKIGKINSGKINIQ